MKITKGMLKRLIKEEMNTMYEDDEASAPTLQSVRSALVSLSTSQLGGIQANEIPIVLALIDMIVAATEGNVATTQVLTHLGMVQKDIAALQGAPQSAPQSAPQDS